MSRKPATPAERQAAELFEAFTGDEAEHSERITVPPLPKAATFVGLCDGVLYTAVRDGQRQRFIHRFRLKDRPVLACSPDGRQLLLLGGSYEFTDRGIVDDSDPSR
jgi:hypothetical protein